MKCATAQLILKNMDIGVPLLSRFDFVFKLIDLSDHTTFASRALEYQPTMEITTKNFVHMSSYANEGLLSFQIKRGNKHNVVQYYNIISTCVAV